MSDRKNLPLPNIPPWQWLLGGGVLLLAGVIVHEALSVVGSGVTLGLLLGGSLIGGLLAALGRERRLRRQAEAERRSAEETLTRVEQQQEALTTLNQRFLAAQSEREVTEALLDFIPHITEVAGVSFVPFDEREHPVAAVSRGPLSSAAMDVWTEYLARPEARHRCQACEVEHSLADTHCPLTPPPSLDGLEGVREMHCQRLWCGTRQVGMITLYRYTDEPLPREVSHLLDTVLAEAALRMDNLRLRRQEREAWGRLQTWRQKQDARSLEHVLLENILHIFDADFAFVLLPAEEDESSLRTTVLGRAPQQMQTFADGFLRSVRQAPEPVLVGNVEGLRMEEGQEGLTLLAAPLRLSDDTSLGAVLVGGYPPLEFTHRHVDLMRTVAGQMALLVQNARLLPRLEYRIIRTERARLAREIHDGLAQTLGFLKLQAAQMRGLLKRGDISRLTEALETWYDTISDAYLDVRDALDGLRLTASEGTLSYWLSQMAEEFEAAAGISVESENLEILDALPPEIQIQVVRIAQEALTNVRKHAQAGKVHLRGGRAVPGELSLEICDDGRGFSPQEADVISRHGLEGMKERAELLGADFQVVSQPGRGTCVQVRIPFKEASRA